MLSCYSGPTPPPPKLSHVARFTFKLRVGERPNFSYVFSIPYMLEYQRIIQYSWIARNYLLTVFNKKLGGMQTDWKMLTPHLRLLRNKIKILAIYGPMIYTAPYVMLLMRADTLQGYVGGVGP